MAGDVKLDAAECGRVFARPQPVSEPAIHRVVLWNVRPETNEEQIEAIVVL